jgi:hypothetical protein
VGLILKKLLLLPAMISDIIGGDADKFTLNDNKLTFKATALKDGNDATYRINIKATKVFDFGAITLLVFSGVKTLFVVIKKARNLSSSVPAPLVLFI